MKDRLSFKGYYSGHMMYLRREDLKNANEHVREFITRSLPGESRLSIEFKTKENQ